MTCPSCGGEPIRPIFYCGEGGADVELRACPFCGGLGTVSRARGNWRLIGQRLRAARMARMVQIEDDDERWVFVIDADTPAQPMPLYAQAKLYGLSERTLEQIEAGVMDPWSISSRLHTLAWPLAADNE